MGLETIMGNRGVGKWKFDERIYLGIAKSRNSAERCPTTGKIKYHNSDAAESALIVMVTSPNYAPKEGRQAGVYQCKSCHKWHVGHST